MNVKKITVWERVNRDEDGKIIGYDHNHIEDNWIKTNKPKPIKPEFKGQECWKGYEWRRVHTYIVNDKVKSWFSGRIIHILKTLGVI